jgi:hypothetical protein
MERGQTDIPQNFYLKQIKNITYNYGRGRFESCTVH